MRWLQKRFALSKKGAVELLVGSLCCALQNISLILPVGLVYSLITHFTMLSAVGFTLTDKSAVFYVSTSFVCMFLMLFTSWFQYNTTFFATYRESGLRRVTLAERLRKIPLSFFAHRDLADITSSIMNDCALLETSQSHYLAPLIGSIISTLFIAAGLFAVNWRMAIAVLWVLPVSFGIVGLSAKVQQGFSMRSLKARIRCNEGVQEFLECSQDLCANNFTDEYVRKLTEDVRSAEKSAMSSELGTAIFVVSAYLVLRLGLASCAFTGAVLYSSGRLDASTFLMFLFAASRLYDPLEVSLKNLAAIIATRPGIDRINDIYSQPLQTGSTTLTNSGYDVKFSHVSFSYDDEEKVIDDVSFTAKQGEVTALVGPSGGGKTTLSRLIVRFWDIDSGKITVGGMNIADIDPEALMSIFSVVFQDVVLFNGSILDNIRIGRKNASDAEVIAAGRLANCEEFAQRLPKGWKTQIGENGCELSGGERQRISIARAILKKAPVILLDEATASLDAENESEVQSAISRLIRNKTVIVIAHRMRTVMGADKVIVLSEGRIAEQGTPGELLESGGIFSRMVKSQGVNQQ